MSERKRSFLRDAWRLAKPYYASDEKWSAWGLLISILALRLLLVGMTVILSFWNREFFNSLQDKNFAAFFELLFVYRYTPSGFMPGFCEIAASITPFNSNFRVNTVTSCPTNITSAARPASVSALATPEVPAPTL